MRISSRFKLLPLGVMLVTCSAAAMLLLQGCAKEEVSTADSSDQSASGNVATPRLGPPGGSGQQPVAPTGGGNTYADPRGSGNANAGNTDFGGPGNSSPGFTGPGTGGPPPGGANTTGPEVSPGPGTVPDQPTGPGPVDTGGRDNTGRAPETTEFVGSGNVGFDIGDFAPEIVGPDLDDVEFKLSDYRGQVVMIDFWGHW